MRIRVTDTGRGIAPAFLPHAFQRFREAETSCSRSHGGLGLRSLHRGAARRASWRDGESR